MGTDAGRGQQGSVSPEQVAELYAHLWGYRVSQALYVVVALGIPDLLAAGPRDSDELAQATGSHPGALYRVLRLLAGVGLFDETSPRRFGLTPLGAGLRANVAGSMRSTVLMALEPANWQAWGHLLYSVRTGEPAFPHVHGMGPFAYFDTHPEAAANFQQAMTSNTARSGAAITRAYDFSGMRRIVDVGGGQGLLLATVLRANPALRGVLFDLPEVVAGAGAVLEAAGVADRCEVVGGDFFESVPPGGDAYVLRQVLHDWDDARAVRILASCRRAMASAGRVLVVERAIAPDYRRALPVLQLDLEMLVNFGGLQRTEAEYGALFAAAGLRLSGVVPLGDAAQFTIYEGTHADES